MKAISNIKNLKAKDVLDDKVFQNSIKQFYLDEGLDF